MSNVKTKRRNDTQAPRERSVVARLPALECSDSIFIPLTAYEERGGKQVVASALCTLLRSLDILIFVLR